MRRRTRSIWMVLFLAVLITIGIIINWPALDCISDGGTWVNGFPLPRCVQ